MQRAVTLLEPSPVDPRAEQVMVAMRDGVRLATDVYLPAVHRRAPRRLGTVLVRMPYDKSGSFGFMAPVAERLNAEGYAVVVQDVRGKVRSEGETRAFVHEVADGYDTLDWIVGQSWSDGAVAMFGDSYYGFTQWAALASGHPALRALVPRMTSTEIGTDWMYGQGVFCAGTMVEWAVHAWLGPQLVETHLDWSLRPVAGIPELCTGSPSPSLDDWIGHGPHDPWWTTRALPSARIDFGAVPTLHSGGFYDVFSRGQLRDHARSVRGGRAPQYLVMGATDHFDDRLTPEGRTADYLLQPELLPAFLDDYLGPALPFLRRHLAGDDVAAGPAVRWECGTAGWRRASRWPPAEAVPLVLHLDDLDAAAGDAQGGVLREPEPTGRGSLRWVHEPERPVPTLVDDPWRPLLRLPDLRQVQVRSDVPTFSGPEVRAPLDLAGPVRAELPVRADAASTHLVATLTDVAPSGEARMIVQGACRVDLAGGEVVAGVDLGDTGYRLETGHRLRLQVACSDYPRFAVHPGTDENPLLAVDTRPVRHELLSRPGVRPRLHLTVLPATAPSR